MSTFTANLSAFFYPTFGEISDLFEDVSLECDDGAAMKANRLLLAVFSGHFRSAVERDPSVDKIRIEGVPSQALKDVLEFVHRGSLNLDDPARAAEFLKTAEVLEVQGVESPSASEAATLSIEAVEEVLGVGKGADEEEEEGEMSEADTEIMDGADMDEENYDKENEEEVVEEGEIMEDEETEEEADASARLFKEISNSLPAINAGDLPENEGEKREKNDKIVKVSKEEEEEEEDEFDEDERRALEEAVLKALRNKIRRRKLMGDKKKDITKKKSHAKKSKKTTRKSAAVAKTSRDDLRLARRFNAAYNSRRYRLRPRILAADADVVVGSGDGEGRCAYTKEVAAISGKIWRCARHSCGFWAYHRRALDAHRVGAH